MNSYYHDEKNQKERTVQLVKEWVKYDNDIRKLQKEISNRKKERALLSHDLMNIMKDTNTGCYELKNGVLMYSVKNVKKPMTKKVLFEVLQKYYNGDVIKAEQLNEFIMNNREEMVQEKLVRKIDADLDG
jgi:hypothetical protein